MSDPQLKQGSLGKRVIIVIEETGGAGFNVLLEGFPVERRRLPEHEQSPAEYWGLRLFAIVVDVVKKTGALVSVTKRSPS